jgi:hypothetical protein
VTTICVFIYLQQNKKGECQRETVKAPIMRRLSFFFFFFSENAARTVMYCIGAEERNV